MQSILAIPFAIPLMPEAVGEVDSSTDGAFEATFAAEAPKVPTTDKDTAEAAALGLVMVPNLTAATKPVPVGPRLDPALGKMTATARGQMAGLLPDPGLQNIAVDAAAAFDLPAQVELQALAGVEPQGVASRLGALATDTAGQRGEPSTPDPEPVPPDAILTDGPHHKAIASHAPVLPVALMPEVAGTTETGRSKVAAHRLRPPLIRVRWFRCRMLPARLQARRLWPMKSRCGRNQAQAPQPRLIVIRMSNRRLP
jgi:hypothetical protein